MTPAELDVLLHYYVSPSDYPHPSGVHDETIEKFLNDGVLAPCVPTGFRENHYEVTDLGKAWIKCILATPRPTQAWIAADGSVIKV